MTLDVLISTFGRDGIERLSASCLPRIDHVCYVISWQSPQGNIPDNLLRKDIRVVTLDGRGLSLNRNNSIEASRADICLIADDDLIYHPEGLSALIAAFEQRPEMDVALVKSTLGKPKIYPSEETQIIRGEYPKGYYVISFEIAFRRSSLPDNARFDTRFGLGAKWYLSGEEELFVDTLLKAGLHCRFIPIEVTSHPHETTSSSRIRLAGVQRATGAVIIRLFPVSFPLRLPLKAWRLSREGGGCLPRTLWNVFSGAIGSLFLPRNHG